MDLFSNPDLIKLLSDKESRGVLSLGFIGFRV